MIKTYIKRPVEVQAVQWNGYNYSEIREFVGSVGDRILTLRGSYNDPDLVIHTLEGDHHALVGDYIIRGVKGEFYPCKSDIFVQTYEEVGDLG